MANANGKITWTNERRKLSDLIPWPRNPRQIKTDQAKRLVESFDQFGQVETIAIGPDGDIYNGHQRLNVLAEKYGKDYEIEVRVSDRALSEKEREKLTIFLHKGAAGEWDFDTLANEFELDDLLEWGFDRKELDLDLWAGPVQDDPGAQMDKAEELREKWGVESGQLWKLGEHRLICGDCTDRAVVERVMDIQPGIMVTDPPYGVEYDPEWRLDANVADVVHGHKLENDDRADWSDAWALFPGDVIYCWHAGAKSRIVAENIEASGFVLLYLIIWNKDLAVFGRGDYHHKHEPCWYAVRKGKNHNFIGDRTQKTVWDIPTIHSFANGHNSEEWGLVGHGTQKPVECMERPIRNHNFQVIYDPFLGSGTTLIACERLGRKCRAVEISPAYCAVAIQRWVDMTGGIPELVE